MLNGEGSVFANWIISELMPSSDTLLTFSVSLPPIPDID